MNIFERRSLVLAPDSDCV